MKISFQRCPRLGLMISRVGRTLFLVTVTIIPLTAMFAPWSHTNPAELISTFPTRHMITTAILLDCGTTFRAFLGVCTDPICSLGVVLAFLKPFLDESAETRLVIRETAAKTEGVVEATVHGRDNVV
jgi:hypothetical protein